MFRVYMDAWLFVAFFALAFAAGFFLGKGKK